MVTLASFCKRRSARGLPTIFERPMTTAWRPASGMPARSMSRITPAGVHGTTPGRPASSAPRLTSWKPSTSFCGAIASSTRAGSMCFGRGSCTRMLCTAASAFKAAIFESNTDSATSGRNSYLSECTPISAAAWVLLRT